MGFGFYLGGGWCRSSHVCAPALQPVGGCRDKDRGLACADPLSGSVTLLDVAEGGMRDAAVHWLLVVLSAWGSALPSRAGSSWEVGESGIGGLVVVPGSPVAPPRFELGLGLDDGSGFLYRLG